MGPHDFVNRRSHDWRRLEELSAHPVERMGEAEVRELGRLYRAATSDLAVAQRDYPGEQVTVYLNQLVGRTHSAVYRSEPLRWRQLTVFYTQTFPALYRQLLPYTLAAALMLLLPAVAAFAAVWRAPETIYTIMGPDVWELVQTVEEGKLWTDIAPAVRPAASTAILTNNIQVMFLAFAGGILAGLLTVYVMIGNGLQLGAVLGLLQYHGLSGGLWEFMSAHGFIELSVIFLAGGCGLYSGDGLLRPGLLGRRQALVERAGLSVRLILGCVPLLVLAGLIEGFISPSALPWWLKLAVGLATGVALHAYWLAGLPTSPPSAPGTG